MFVYVLIFFGSGMPQVPNDGDGSFLTFVFIDSFEVAPSCMRRGTVLNVDKWFISNILSD